MTKYREIIRLTSLGLSQRNIMRSLGVAQKTVVKVQHRAKELSLEWPLDESMTDKALEKLMFPTKQSSDTSKKAYARLCLHPQRTASQWCKQKALVDRIHGGLPHGR